jgi:hypothetical protein
VRVAKIFCCPNCFAQFEKDDSILMLSSGAAVAGGGISWSGKLERDIGQIKRVKYCKSCRQPIDFHALLRGKLDYYGWGNPRRLSWLSAHPRRVLVLVRLFLLGESCCSGDHGHRR